MIKIYNMLPLFVIIELLAQNRGNLWYIKNFVLAYMNDLCTQIRGQIDLKL